MPTGTATAALSAAGSGALTADNMLNEGALLARYTELGDKSVIDRGVARMKKYCQTLQAEDGWFRETATGAETARASGQCALGLALFAAALPKGHDDLPNFHWAIRKWSYAIERAHDANGIWHAVPNDFTSPPDSAATALLTAALAISLEQTWLERLEFRDILKLAVASLKKETTAEGKLGGCVAGFPTIADGDKHARVDREAVAAERIVIVEDMKERTGLTLALACAERYRKSPAASVPEDLERDWGPLYQDNALPDYCEELPDGRLLVHVTMPFQIDPWKRGKANTAVSGGLKPNKEMSVNELLLYAYRYSRSDPSIAHGPVNHHDPVPESLEKQAFPMGGISIWLKENPSIRVVSSDMGSGTLYAHT